MNLTCASYELLPRRPFLISRGRRTEVRNVFLRLEHEGLHGYGEASPNAFYGETWQGVTEKLESARDFISSLDIHSIADIEAAWTESWHHLAPSRAAQCALDIALWDWFARRQAVSTAELAWNEPPHPVRSFATIGLSTPDELPAKIDELRGFPWIKIKSDASASLDTVRHVRQRTSALIAVDANCAWAAHNLDALAHELSALGVDFIEQPLPPERNAELNPVMLPLFADESCVTEEDVPRVCEHFDGFNIKLVKCGGITPARRMIRHGRTLGKQIMVGCMLESSVLIAAGAVIAQKTDYADLDGAWLIGNDPFTGWKFDHGTLRPPKANGLGIAPAAELFS
jgi:L-alanine-DL-glutamate epimerase-like enolase superfamily enzyme